MRSAASVTCLLLGISAALSACGGNGSPSSGEATGSGAGSDAGPTTGSGGGTTDPPKQIVADCDGLGEVGAWENITPPFPMLPTALAVDPINSGTLYFGTSPGGLPEPTLGIWKSTDCGSTWVHVNEGTKGGGCDLETKPCSTVLDFGRQWTFGIDPEKPDILYTNNGYGAGDLGLMRSTDGGANWWQVWPECADPLDCFNTKTDPINQLAPGFIGDVVVDPYDPKHILTTFHADCKNVTFCVGESFDRGETWRIRDGNPAMGTAHESRLGFLGNSSSWVFIAGDIWRTLDSGANWEKVGDAEGGGMLYKAKNGVYYIGALDTLYRSDDEGATWTQLPDTGPIIQGLVGDGTTMFVSRYAAGFPWGENLQPYMTSPENDGLTWTPYPSPPFTQGAIAMAIDTGHNLLFSVNSEDGIWRVRFR
jgi:hypothetical protein